MLILRRTLLLLMIAASTLALTGCGGYVLHGRVVSGSMSHISIADRAGGNPTAQGGVGGVSIAVFREPGRLSQQLIATGTSAPDGTFEVQFPASTFGAGWMDEKWLIQATRQGYQSAEATVALPMNSRTRPAVVTLAPGRSIPFQQLDDYKRDLERFQWD